LSLSGLSTPASCGDDLFAQRFSTIPRFDRDWGLWLWGFVGSEIVFWSTLFDFSTIAAPADSLPRWKDRVFGIWSTLFENSTFLEFFDVFCGSIAKRRKGEIAKGAAER
jgi:hypothetical protein